MAIMFIIFGTMQTSDGPFRRPHPVLWRMCFAISMAYELCLIFLLFQVSYFFPIKFSILSIIVYFSRRTMQDSCCVMSIRHLGLNCRKKTTVETVFSTILMRQIHTIIYGQESLCRIVLIFYLVNLLSQLIVKWLSWLAF